MADNTTLNTGSGGDTIASDDISGVKFPRSKITLGADGVNDGDVSSANPLPISAASLPLPSGAATAANQSTGNTSLSSIDGKITACNTGAVVLAAGTAAVGKLSANDGVDIGDVTINNGSGASAVNIQDGGNIITVDGTVAAAQSGTWTSRLADGSGNNLTSKVAGSERALSIAIVDGSGNQVTSFGGSGGTSQTDDAAFTPASGSFTPIGGIVTADSVDSGDGGAFAMLANRQQKVTLYDSAGVEVSVGGGTQYDEDTVHSSGDKLTLAGAVRRDTAASGASADGDRATINVDANGRLWVNPSGITLTVDGSAVTQPISHAALTELAAAIDTEVQCDIVGALPAGTNAIGKLAANSGVTIGAVEIASGQVLGTVTTVGTVTTCSTLTGSGVAHDAADSGNPHKIGAKATSSLSGLTLVASADRTDLFAGLDGVQINRPHCNLEDIVDGNQSNTDGSSTQVIAAAGAGIKQYLTSVILTNTSSSNIYVEMKSGTTVKATIPLPANGGAIFNPPVPLRPNAANEAWNFDPSAATTTVYCTAIGFKSKI